MVRKCVVQPFHYVIDEAREPPRGGQCPRYFAGCVGSLVFWPSALSSRHFLFDHLASSRAHKWLAVGKDTLIKISFHHPRVAPKAGYLRLP